MTQTLERGIKSEHSEAERTRGNERPTMFGLALGDVSKHPIDWTQHFLSLVQRRARVGELW
jgi:hypothetical protein